MTMDRTISNFIRALRNADVRVSTAETLDALGAVELVGYRDKAYLKRSLATVLPKTVDEKIVKALRSKMNIANQIMDEDWRAWI